VGTRFHNTAVVEDGAEIGTDVSVGPFSFIEAGARIGDRCLIGPHVTVYGQVSVGADCRVHAGATLGDLPQDYGFKDCESRVTIGSGCLIREGVTIHRGTKPGTQTTVGDNCFLMAFSHLAHNVALGRNVILANGVLLAGYVEVGDRAFLSGNAIVHQFVKIGRVAMLGGGAAVSKDVPPFVMMRPAAYNVVAGLNVVGMRRAGLTQSERAEIARAFRILYRSGLNVTKACDAITQTCAPGPALEIPSFIARSTRGISGFDGDDDQLSDPCPEHALRLPTRVRDRSEDPVRRTPTEGARIVQPVVANIGGRRP
jgi:UDP-N-acetylglucosamine acyltransferase